MFGLGDTAYEHFNAVGKFLDQTLEKMGGQRVWRFGEGNSENLMTEEQFEEWKHDLWTGLAEHYRSLAGGN